MRRLFPLFAFFLALSARAEINRELDDAAAAIPNRG
jgi:hypothetical protein